METAKKPYRSNVVLIVLIAGLAAFVLYVAFFVNPAKIIETLSKTNLVIFLFAFVAFTLNTFCSSLVWNNLLSNLSVKISRRKTFLFTWVGLFFDATVPQIGWSAEISKTYLLAKDVKIESGQIAASVVGQKMLTMTITISALSTGLGLVLYRYSLPFVITLLFTLVLVLSILTLAIIFYISFRPTTTKKLLGWAVKIAAFFRKNWNPENFKGKAEKILEDFHFGFRQLKSNPKGLIQPCVFAITGFVFEIAVVFLTFLALGQPVPVDVVLIVFTLTGTLQTVGVTIFGFPELIMTLTFTALYIDPVIAVSVALLTRVVNLWFRLFFSYTALQWAGIRILKKTQ
jgi:uncharacterized protein (TIRG00374 family)